jgi:uncharacterized membrane protein
MGKNIWNLMILIATTGLYLVSAYSYFVQGKDISNFISVVLIVSFINSDSYFKNKQ